MTDEQAKQLEWYQQMQRDYPAFFTVYPECNGGWESLLREIFDVIQAKVKNPDNFTLLQVKEKFGELRFYYQLQNVENDVAEAVSAAVEAAERKSLETCELTGKPGTLVSRDGWLRVLSDEHIREGDEVFKPVG